MQSLLERLIPFLFLGILIVLGIVGFILFSYLLIFGTLVGFVLFSIAWVRGLFSRKRKTLSARQKKEGRIIDHDP